MSQEKFGELMRTPEKPNGVTKQAVGAWESDRNQMNSNQVVRACEIFNASPTWLLTGKGDRRRGATVTSITHDLPNNLDYFNDREKSLVTIFRETDDDGRTFIEDQASTVPRKRLSGSLPRINNKT